MTEVIFPYIYLSHQFYDIHTQLHLKQTNFNLKEPYFHFTNTVDWPPDPIVSILKLSPPSLGSHVTRNDFINIPETGDLSG